MIWQWCHLFHQSFLNSFLGSASTWDQTFPFVDQSSYLSKMFSPMYLRLERRSGLCSFHIFLDILISILERSFLNRSYALTQASCEDHCKRLHSTVQWPSLVIFAPWWYLENSCFSFSLEILASFQRLMFFQSDRLVLVNSFIKRKKIEQFIPIY